jgi:hypothetical protein
MGMQRFSRIGPHLRTGGFTLFILGSDFAEKGMIFLAFLNSVLIAKEEEVLL